MLSNSNGSGIKANVSGITEFHVPTDQLALIPPIYTATSRRTNLLHLARRIAESDISVRCREAAAMEPQFSIDGPEFRNDPLPSDIHAA